MSRTTVRPTLVPHDILKEHDAKRKLCAGWCDLLQEVDWSHFCTCTFRYATSPDLARREFLEGFVRRLEQRAQKRVEWYYVIETSPGGVVHLHALLGQTDHLPTVGMRQAWKKGITSIQRYDPSRGAARYVTKAIASGTVDYDVSPYLTMKARG